MSDKPIYMLNVLWFKKEGGAEKYRQYLKAAQSLLSGLGVKLDGNYVPEESLIGDWNPDVFFMVEYPSQAAFESLIKNPEYRKIMHLREEALDNSLLIRCSKTGKIGV